MLPILLRLGPVTIYSYGFCLAMAFLVATFVIWQEARKRGFDEEKIMDFILISLGGGLLLGRIFYIFFNFSYYQSHLLEIVLFWQSNGFHSIGLCSGAVLAGVWYLRKLRWPIWVVYDMTVLGLITGQIGEKIGLFLSGVLEGKETNFFLGIKFPPEQIKRWPVSLLEAVFYVIILGLLLFINQKNKKRTEPQKGLLINLYLIFIALGEIGFSFLREKSSYLGKINLTFAIPIVIILLSVIVFYFRQERSLQKDLGMIKKLFPGDNLSKKQSSETLEMDDLVKATQNLKKKNEGKDE